MTRLTKLPTRAELDAMLDAIEAHLQPEEAAILLIATPKEGGGVSLSICMNCSDAIVKPALHEALRRYDEKTVIFEESAH